MEPLPPAEQFGGNGNLWQSSVCELMLQIMQATLKRAVVLILGTALGKGILLFLGTIGIHPEEWVAAMLGAAYANLDAIAWILSSIVGFVTLAVWEFVQRRLVPADGTIQRRSLAYAN
jgi:hypothetical protein